MVTAVALVGLSLLAAGLRYGTRDPLDGVSRIEILRRIWAAECIRERKS